MCLFLLCIVPPAPSLGGSDVATIAITLLIARALSQPTGSEDSLIAVTNCPFEIYAFIQTQLMRFRGSEIQVYRF